MSDRRFIGQLLAAAAILTVWLIYKGLHQVITWIAHLVTP
jgi:hypothetical protein